MFAHLRKGLGTFVLNAHTVASEIALNKSAQELLQLMPMAPRPDLEATLAERIEKEKGRVAHGLALRHDEIRRVHADALQRYAKVP